MVQWHLRSNRGKTGKLLKRIGKKIKANRGRDFLPTHIGKRKTRTMATKGGGEKTGVMMADFANILVAGKAQKAKIISVTGNTADSQFVRRNIITKGAIIQTDMGKARVTSRPGQDGNINAVLIEEEKKEKK